MYAKADAVGLDDCRSDIWWDDTCTRQSLAKHGDYDIACGGLVSSQTIEVFLRNVGALVDENTVTDVLEADDARAFLGVVARLQV
jgi:hypothetical protein